MLKINQKKLTFLFSSILFFLIPLSYAHSTWHEPEYQTIAISEFNPLTNAMLFRGDVPVDYTGEDPNRHYFYNMQNLMNEINQRYHEQFGHDLPNNFALSMSHYSVDKFMRLILLITLMIRHHQFVSILLCHLITPYQVIKLKQSL